MSDIGYGVSSTGSLEDAIKAMPTDLRSYVRSGFNILATLDPKVWGQLVTAVRATTPYPNSLELRPLEDALSIDRNRLDALVTATRVLLSIAAFRDDDLDEIIRASAAAKVLDASGGPAVRSFLENAISDRRSLRRDLQSTTLQHSILPTLIAFDVAVDLRLGFEENTSQLAVAAPVAVVHIDTDTSEKEVWFQMSRAQLESLHDRLTTVLSRLKIAEGLAKNLHKMHAWNCRKLFRSVHSGQRGVYRRWRNRIVDETWQN
jgi:hypothetical protein